MVAEEHVASSKSNLSFSFEVSDDDGDDDDEDVLVFEPSKDPVNELVISPAETEKEINSTVRKPPQGVPVTTESPSGSDKDDSNSFMMPRKQRRRDPSSGVLITEPVQQPTSNVEPAQVNQYDQSPIFDKDFLANEETFSSGSSSAPPPLEHDYASVNLAKLLAFQESIPHSRGKGISIGSGEGGDEDSQQTIFELKQDIIILKQKSIEKDLLIGKLDVRVYELEKEILKRVSKSQIFKPILVG
ncbi:unnamed protein product [Lactuca virosa]|uniref:Uncharacterized protein n=1 Tax=Lactuca virosa TaxID=75947 RepID=A0AAU9NGP7_9ASTR|nr:unnamed protein product [Lactuca virosa]